MKSLTRFLRLLRDHSSIVLAFAVVASCAALAIAADPVAVTSTLTGAVVSAPSAFPTWLVSGATLVVGTLLPLLLTGTAGQHLFNYLKAITGYVDKVSGLPVDISKLNDWIVRGLVFVFAFALVPVYNKLTHSTIDPMTYKGAITAGAIAITQLIAHHADPGESQVAQDAIAKAAS